MFSRQVVIVLNNIKYQTVKCLNNFFFFTFQNLKTSCSKILSVSRHKNTLIKQHKSSVIKTTTNKIIMPEHKYLSILHSKLFFLVPTIPLNYHLNHMWKLNN